MLFSERPYGLVQLGIGSVDPWWNEGYWGDTNFDTSYAPNAMQKNKALFDAGWWWLFNEAAGSFHSGGVNVSMADGSNRFIKDTIRNRIRHAQLAAFALLWFITGCGDPATGTFDAAASKKIAGEKGIGRVVLGPNSAEGPPTRQPPRAIPVVPRSRSGDRSRPGRADRTASRKGFASRFRSVPSPRIPTSFCRWTSC